VDELFLERIIDFGAQTTHDDIHDVGVGAEINVPYMLGDLLARHGLARGTRQLRSEEEFLWREIEIYSASCRAMTSSVDLEIVNAQLPGLSR